MTLSFPKEAPWAELHVLHGGPPRFLAFSGGAPAHLVVGSGARASLRFDVEGVAPHQFDLVWDGDNTWLEDPLRLGRTRVNGRPLNEWTAVCGSALIIFGAVHLALRSEGRPPRRRTPDFDALERARLFQSGTLRKRDTLRIRLPPKAEDG